MESPPLSQPSANWIDRVAAWLLPFHPAAGLVSVLLLSGRSKTVAQGLRTQRKDLLVWGALALAGWLSVWVGADVARGAVNWLIPFVFFWLYALGKWAVRDPEAFLKDLIRATGLLAAIVVVARALELEVSIAGVTLLDRFGPGQRAYVLGQGANALAIVLEVSAVGGLALLASADTWKERLEGALTGLVSLVAIFITLSRGAIVGVVGAVAVGAALINWRFILWGLAAALAVMAANPLLRSRFLSIFDLTANRSNVVRLRIWEGTLKMLRDHLWFGVGPGNFGLVYPRYRLPDDANARSPHSIYLNIASGWGIVGSLLLFGWIGWVMLRNLRQAMAPYKKAIFLTLLAFWIHVFFDDLITPQAAILLGLLDRDEPAKTEA